MSALKQETGAAESRPQPPRYHIPKNDFIIRHKNEIAQDELIIPIQLVCNTPDEVLTANVKENSSQQLPWVNALDPHDTPAILVGGGPSIADQIDEILKLKLRGGTIFAMNGAANYLAERGIFADYQVIVDARERTAQLFSRDVVKGYLFGSQVHPSLIDRAWGEGLEGVTLFHINFFMNHEDFLALLPEERVNNEQFVLVGSHGSVGNVSLAVAYALGYRDLHVFGFDSSFREENGHAYSQPMNAEEPVVDVEYGGKKYRMTYTMKSQADVFPRLAYELEGLGVKFSLYGEGFVQDRWAVEHSKPVEVRERDKYAEMWKHDEYIVLNPGTEKVEDAIERLGISVGDRLFDLGCGSGYSTVAFNSKGVNATGVDITDQGLKASGVTIPFVNRPLWDLPMHLKADWGFCTDVMEHIPTDLVSVTLANIANACSRGVYFLIDSVPDEMGIIIGQPLHLTVKPPKWWASKLRQHFAVVEEYTGGVFVCRHRH